MAGTTVNVRLMETGGSNLETTKSVNKLVDDVETLRAALSAGGVVAVTELMTDHATFKTAADAVETLVEELAVDHATFKTAVDQTETLIEELHDDHATVVTILTDIKALVNTLAVRAQNRVWGNPGLAIDTNFDVKNANAISYTTNGGSFYDAFATLAANTNFDTGTAKVIAADQWAAALLEVSAAGTATLTWGADAASEAAAVTALPAAAANVARVGFITVKTGAGVTWTAGTDALKTGTGGTVATETNYYNGAHATAAAAVTSSPPATITAAKPASGPATLSASGAIPSAPATLSAAVPSATAVDAAGDITAFKIADDDGDVIA